jgi:hypothetical protein
MSVSANVKKIPVEQLRPGMYIHDINCSWLDHPFVGNSFAVHDEARVKEITALGIREVYIDTKRGADVVDAVTEAEEQ